MSRDEIIKCARLSESSSTSDFFSNVYYAVEVDYAFVFVEEILKCDYSNESYSEVISCGAVYHSVTGFRLLSLVQMKIIEQYLRLVLFTTLYMVSLSHNIFMKCYFKPSWAWNGKRGTLKTNYLNSKPQEIKN